jgi:hypothetical protein
VHRSVTGDSYGHHPGHSPWRFDAVGGARKV